MCMLKTQQDMGHVPLLGFSECFGVPELRPDWSVQTRKTGVLISFVEVLSKWCTRKRPREKVGKTAYQKWE